MNIISFFNAGSAAKLVKVDERELNDMRGQIAAINRVQAVIEFGLDGTVLNANQNFLDLLGYSLEEIKGRHHSIFVDPNYRASQEYRLFWDRLGRGQFETGQYKRIGKGGKEVWIQASYNPILTADGRPFKVVKFATDITDEAQRKIKAERELQQIVGAMDSTSSNVMVADPDRKIIYMNRAVEKMLRAVEPDLRKALPHFSVDKVIGSNIDIFHRNPSHQMQLLANLRDTYTSQITVAGITFRLIVNPIFSESGDRLGTVVEWIDRTQEVAAEHEMSRILGALETTTTNVMIADPDRKIIYMNKSVESMLRVAEADIRSVLPHFSVDKIVGSNMDIFHKNPAHQMKLLENLTSTYTSNIVVGKRHFRLVANPIFSKDGSRLGSVVEWQDRT
ncbi:MAG TPA: PAS domain-containing protein, partial [Cellvibrio sp.]